MFCIHYIEKGFARLGHTIERVLDFYDISRNGGGNGTIGQFMLQFVQLGPRFVVSTADTGHFLDVFRSCIQVVVLIALPHQNGLILEIGSLQFSTAVGNLLTQGSVAKSCNNLAFPDFLSNILYGEHDDLF